MTEENITFDSLGLSNEILKSIKDTGYETPSPIQAESIPHVLAGRDIIGQAQTGTGKTAAFALPALSNLDVSQSSPQVLVLAPTRELAIQVAEAFRSYAKPIKGFKVLPIYGGQDYKTQLQALKRGVHVVVGTPGRVMDHMRRGTLKLDGIKMLVLDEADEMLRMGFIDDVEWVMDQIKTNYQTALFSATMPQQVRRLAEKFLNNPAHITIKVKTTTAETIRQRYWLVTGTNKLDALTRILEAEDFDAMIIFVRTKMATEELSQKIQARGFSAAALSGDVPQRKREQTINAIKKGNIDILVATDVAARGLDVERISHVVNYDIPHDTEAYVHRIGRTGRAGREGDAILFVAPRERRMLKAIEKATRKRIEEMILPTAKDLNARRIDRFKQRLGEILEKEDLSQYLEVIDSYQQENDVPPKKIAAAIAHLLQSEAPFIYKEKEGGGAARRESYGDSDDRRRSHGDRDDSRRSKPKRERGDFNKKSSRPIEKGMDRFRIEVGHNDSVKPGNIVGAIANEAGLDSQYIGSIQIFDDHSLVDLPEGMPTDVFKTLQSVWVSNKKLNIKRFDDKPSAGRGEGKPRSKKKARKS